VGGGFKSPIESAGKLGLVGKRHQGENPRGREKLPSRESGGFIHKGKREISGGMLVKEAGNDRKGVGKKKTHLITYEPTWKEEGAERTGATFPNKRYSHRVVP